jgi:hypothetical protein
MLVGDKMGECAGRRRHRHEHIEAHCAEASRQRAAEWQQPQHVEEDVAEIGMQQRIGDEGPDLRPCAPGKIDLQRVRIVAARDEAEQVDGPVLGFRRQQHPQMDERDQPDIGRQRARQRQDRLVRRIRRRRLVCGNGFQGNFGLLGGCPVQIGGFGRTVQVHKGSKQAPAFRNEKGRVLRTPALGSLIFRAQGWYPPPLPAMTKLV